MMLEQFINPFKDGMQMIIAVAGTGYVGLSLAVLQLARHNEMFADDIVPDFSGRVRN